MLLPWQRTCIVKFWKICHWLMNVIDNIISLHDAHALKYTNVIYFVKQTFFDEFDEAVDGSNIFHQLWLDPFINVSNISSSSYLHWDIQLSYRGHNFGILTTLVYTLWCKVNELVWLVWISFFRSHLHLVLALSPVICTQENKAHIYIYVYTYKDSPVWFGYKRSSPGTVQAVLL